MIEVGKGRNTSFLFKLRMIPTKRRKRGGRERGWLVKKKRKEERKRGKIEEFFPERKAMTGWEARKRRKERGE